ncbi:hypothetical protein [Nonomuraea angiospora]
MPGALVADGGEVTHVKAHLVIPVDASGAGDTFDGAFAARLLPGATEASAPRSFPVVRTPDLRSPLIECES